MLFQRKMSQFEQELILRVNVFVRSFDRAVVAYEKWVEHETKPPRKPARMIVRFGAPTKEN